MSLGFPAEHFRLSSTVIAVKHHIIRERKLDSDMSVFHRFTDESQSERSGCDRNTAERRTEGQSSEFKEQTHKTRREEILEAGNTKSK